MIVIGTKTTVGDFKVDGMFVDGSQVATISATAPPNPPEPQAGKDIELHHDSTGSQLSWVFVDRPLTDAEQVTQLEAQNAQMLLALVEGGLM